MAECASVTSQPQPMEGQSHRSSGNFSTQNCSGDNLTWNCPAGIVFDVMEDKSWQHDPTIFSNVSNGTVTPNYSSRSLYIANPRWASSDFLVTVSVG